MTLHWEVRKRSQISLFQIYSIGKVTVVVESINGLLAG